MSSETQAQNGAEMEAAAQAEAAAPVEAQPEPVAEAAPVAMEVLPAQVAVSTTPGLDAYRELLDLQDERDRHLAEIDLLNADLASLMARRSEHHTKLSGLPEKARSLKQRVMSRVDTIVGAFTGSS